MIDTNIWINGCVQDKEYYRPECAEFLWLFAHNPKHMLALDYTRKMVQEYEDNLEKNIMFQQIYKKLSRTGRIHYCSETLPEKHFCELKKRGFHEPEDMVFAGVCFNSDKFLVSNDSDYGTHGEEEKKEVYDYMKNNMGMTVVNSDDACVNENIGI